MANELVQPYTGPHTIDLAAIAPQLIDLAQGALRGLRREKPGMEGVVAELETSVPALGVKGSISPDVFASFKKNHGLILQIRAARVLVNKAAEILEESEAYYEDQREGDVALMVAAVRMSARQKNESILAAFEKMLTYYAQTAMKAVKTRQKNAEGADDAPPTLDTPKEASSPAAGSDPAAATP